MQQKQGCEVCRRGVYSGSPPELMATSVIAHAHLRRCRVCGSWWEEGEREAHVISEAEAQRTFPEMFSFAATVETEALALSATCPFRAHVVAANDVLLMTDGYALRFRLDRDGVSLTYVDKAGDVVRSFDLFGFFWRQRRSMLRFSDTKPEPEDEVRAQVAALVGHLVTAGADILKGEKAWQADYGLESVPVRELEPFFLSASSAPS